MYMTGWVAGERIPGLRGGAGHTRLRALLLRQRQVQRLLSIVCI